ncbi:hypothetical protein Hanom_Chr11g00974861 [Helianthus anomalus]
MTSYSMSTKILKERSPPNSSRNTMIQNLINRKKRIQSFTQITIRKPQLLENPTIVQIIPSSFRTEQL